MASYDLHHTLEAVDWLLQQRFIRQNNSWTAEQIEQLWLRLEQKLLEFPFERDKVDNQAVAQTLNQLR